MAVLPLAPAQAEDGYDLWLRYAPIEGEAATRAAAAQSGPVELRAAETPTTRLAVAELERGLAALLGEGARSGPGIVLARRERMSGTDALEHLPLIHALPGAFRITRLPDERTLIVARDDIGLLYGAFEFLRQVQAGNSFDADGRVFAPAMPLRLLNHWDNPDGHVERGYSGRSIFDWWRLPGHLDQRMTDYARANASIGINGAVVNNVNASPLFLTDRYLPKLQRLADAWRPYGIKLYISARFSAPRDVGGLATADPLDPAVRAWWKARADAIYAAIPDFGGFLVKANSEGQPGPQDYGRTHADGANMLAQAVGARGTVIWRAFVYSAEDETDRAKQAYDEFVPLDGQFADNVIVQVKNGPIDFQPREPFHPMFGAMPKTKLMLEAQITKEYLGFSTHLAYLAPMWKEVLAADTGRGPAASTGPHSYSSRGGTVADVIAPVGMAGVANIGSDRNWSGSHMDQANWYAFGRLAWDPSLTSEQIAREWAAQTFHRSGTFLATWVPVMFHSRQAVANYMTPLGLTHQMDTGHHYGPGPWVCDLARPEWNPCYYHRADKRGIGFDRTASGSNALEQYAPAIAAQWRDPATMDEDYLLWFHHLPWDFRTRTGLTLWEEMVRRYDDGVTWTRDAAATWNGLARFVDAERHRDVAEYLAIQSQEAKWWRDASLAYWMSRNGLPLPPGAAAPEHTLEHYRSLTFPEAPGN